MNIYESAQDYLERILMLNEKLGKVRSIDIAIDMNITKQSVCRAIKNLRENDYIVIDKDGYINLTNKGNEVASRVYERHVVLTEFLTSLGVPLSIAIHDACKMEHDISNESFIAIKEITNKK